jgi:hypothetical protein
VLFNLGAGGLLASILPLCLCDDITGVGKTSDSLFKLFSSFFFKSEEDEFDAVVVVVEDT